MKLGISEAQIATKCEKNVGEVGMEGAGCYEAISTVPVTASQEGEQGAKWPTFKDRPCWRVYEKPVLSDEGLMVAGVWYHSLTEAKANKDPQESNIWICSPLYIDAITSYEGAEFGRNLRFVNSLGYWREWAMPMALLSGSGEEVRSELLRMGVEIDPKYRAKLADYFFSQKPQRQAICATRTGWHNENLFVMPDNTVGEGDVVFQSEVANLGEYTKGGSLESWKKEIGECCKGNPVLILAVCTALAGPLLQPLHRAGGGFQLIGDSSSGKSTALQLSASVWGKSDDFIRTWRATGNGLEGVAALRNDTILILDEISEADPREIGSTVYALANGTGKQRAGKIGQAKKVNRWRIMLLSSGERSLEAHMAEGGKLVKAGQLVRLLNVPVNRVYGVFDDLHGSSGGRELSDDIKAASNKHYGHLGHAFISELVGRKVLLSLGSRLESMKDHFPCKNGQEGRGADRFAIAALAGELAIEFGLLPWDKGDALNSLSVMFNVWKVQRGCGQDEDRQILQSIIDYIGRHGDSRFSNSIDMEMNVRERAGWWKKDQQGERIFLFLGAGLKEATLGHDFRRVQAAIESANWIVSREQKRLTKTTRIGGVNRKLYWLQPNELDIEKD